MRQVFLEKGTLAIKEVCQPSLDDYSVLISVSYSFMSMGTGLASILNANQNLFFNNIPQRVKKIIEIASQRGIDYAATAIKDRLAGNAFVFGHSCSGTVLALGKKVQKFRVGDLVACAGPGLANHADIVCVPESLVVRVNKEESLKASCLTGIGAMALQSVRRAELQLGESVAVFGLDVIGQLMMRLAKKSGCNVIGIDAHDERLAYTQKIGNTAVYDFVRDNLEQSISLFTDAYGIDCVIISPDCIDERVLEYALKITRKKGRIVIAGSHQINLPQQLAYQKEIDILFSLSYGPGRYDPVYEYQGNDYPYSYVRWTENRNMEFFASLLEDKSIPVQDLIEYEISLDALSTTFEEIRKQKHLGAVLNFASKKELIHCPEKKDDEVLFTPAWKNSLHVGVMGLGRFMRFTLMPVVKKHTNAEFALVVDQDITSVVRAKKQHPNTQILVGGPQLFYNCSANVIFISPAFDVTLDDIIALLERKKAIFLGRPLALTLQELQQLEEFFKKNPHLQSLLCVGFYRSFSPFVEKIKRVVKDRHSPLMISYRINLGALSPEERVHAQWKYGRVIAQGSHIFDLFFYLVDAKPASVSVDSIRPLHVGSFPTDNFIVQITFQDGSVCSLLFTSLGHSGIGNERMELFFDSKAIVLEDYQLLQGYGLPSSFNEKLRSPNNGYEMLLEQFLAGIQKEQPCIPMSIERIMHVARLSLAADTLACQGGGSVSKEEPKLPIFTLT